MVFPTGPIKVRDLIGGALMVMRKLSSFRRHKILSGIKDLRNDRKSKMELIPILDASRRSTHEFWKTF